MKVALGIVTVGALLLAGCAGHSGGTGQKFAPASGASCKQMQKDLAKMAGQGVAGKIDAAANGRKLSAQAKEQVDRYNTLLEAYMGAGCHKN
jgi:hypothetical protein